MEPVLDAVGVVKRWDETSAIGPVDLRLRRGEILGIVGPRGAGKTTLLGMIWGFVRPDRGTITVLGRTPHLEQIDLRLSVGFARVPVPRGSAKGFDFLESTSNFYPGWNWERALALARSFSIDLTTSVRDLTGGRRALLGILSALTHRPRLLILDEPTVALDPADRNAVHECLDGFVRDQGGGVILASRNAHDTGAVADSILPLPEGDSIRGVGPPLSEIDESVRSSPSSRPRA